MKLGELVETLIWVCGKDNLTRSDRDALADACNILDELPLSFTAEQAREFIRQALKKED